MKPSLAHISPTLPAVLATGVAVTLSVFLLAGAEPRGEPAPLLPAIGGAAVHVIAGLPGTSQHSAPRFVARPDVPVEPVTTPAQRVAPQRQVVVSHTHRPKHHGRVRVHRAAPLPARVASPAAPTPVVRRQTFRARPAPRGKARGHSHSHAHGVGPAAAAGARTHGHGNAFGHTHHTGARTHGHGNAFGHTHHGASPGHAQKAPTAPHPEHVAPPKANGGGPPPGHGGGNGHGGKQ